MARRLPPVGAGRPRDRHLFDVSASPVRRPRTSGGADRARRARRRPTRHGAHGVADVSRGARGSPVRNPRSARAAVNSAHRRDRRVGNADACRGHQCRGREERTLARGRRVARDHRHRRFAPGDDLPVTFLCDVVRASNRPVDPESTRGGPPGQLLGTRRPQFGAVQGTVNPRRSPVDGCCRHLYSRARRPSHDRFEADAVPGLERRRQLAVACSCQPRRARPRPFQRVSAGGHAGDRGGASRVAGHGGRVCGWHRGDRRPTFLAELSQGARGRWQRGDSSGCFPTSGTISTSCRAASRRPTRRRSRSTAPFPEALRVDARPGRAVV